MYSWCSIRFFWMKALSGDQVVFHFKLVTTLLAIANFSGNNTLPENLFRDLSFFTFIPNAAAPFNFGAFLVLIMVKLVNPALN